MNQEENKQELQNNVNEVSQPAVTEIPVDNNQPVEPINKQENGVEPVVINTTEPVEIQNESINNNVSNTTQQINEVSQPSTVEIQADNKNIQEPIVTQPVINETPVEIKQDIEPVKEIKIEEKQEETTKNGKSKTILLVIFFIFLFAFVMGMPYINEFIDDLRKDAGLSEIEKRAKQIEEAQNKEREKRQSSKKDEQSEQEQTTQETEIPEVLTCTVTVPASDTVNYDKTIVQKFEYNKDNQVLTSEIVNTYTFLEQNEVYLTQKNNCDENSLKYIDKVGYSFSCSYTDLSVVIGNEFELDTFKPINDGDTTIIANATYKEDVEALKTRLINSGYTCE